MSPRRPLPPLRRIGAASLCVLALAPVARPQDAAPPSAAPPPAATPARGREISAGEYRRLMADANAALGRRPADDAELARLARALRPVRHIRADDGRRIDADLRRDADILQSVIGSRSPAGAPADVRARFAALDRLSRRQAPPASPDPAAQAAAILKEKQFARDPQFTGAPPDLPWLEKVRKWFADLFDRMLKALGRFLRWLFGRWRFNPGVPRWQGVGDVVLLVLYFLAAVAASVALYWLGRLGWRSYQRRTGRLREDPGGPTGLDLTDEGILDPLSSAHDLATRGDYRSAIRLAYIASLRRLEGSGRLVLEKNRTNWEYQRALRHRDREAYDRMLPATRLFDRVWYGRRSASREEYEGLVRIHDALPDTPPPAAPDAEPTTGAPAADAGGNAW